MDSEPSDSVVGLAGLPVDAAKLAREERLVRDGFWRKPKRALGRIPFAEEAVAAFYCAADPQTPTYVRAVLIGALAYFIVPADVIPDVIAGLGFTDDASVLLTALSAVGGHLKPHHHDQARAFFAGAATRPAEGNPDRP